MGMLRAVTIAVLATWGLAAATARADGPAPGRAGPDRYPPYDAAPGFFDFDWSGFYVGAHLGGAHTNFEATETSPVPLILTYSQDAASGVGGVQAGWQKQWEKIVAGIEVTYAALPFDETELSPLVAGLERTAELHDLITLTGRLGYADGRWLAYAKGGWASAEVDVTYRDTIKQVAASSGGRESGWTAGVGIDYALSYNLFLGVEYNYLHFNADLPAPPVPNTQADSGEFDIQTLVVRLNYRIGGPAH
jgi:outer membrane immunogenic protein